MSFNSFMQETFFEVTMKSLFSMVKQMEKLLFHKVSLSLICWVMSFMAHPLCADIIRVPSDFSSIQDGILAAYEGDTVLVSPGNYTENIIIEKSIFVQSVAGNQSTLVFAQKADQSVFGVFADNVVIKGFSIAGANSNNCAGIYIHDHISKCSIVNNLCGLTPELRNDFGIFLANGDSHSISGNSCTFNTIGIYVQNTHHVQLVHNTMQFNLTGLLLNQSKSNDILYNQFFQNEDEGIQFKSAHDNQFTFNTVEKNTYGIILNQSDNNHLFLNTFKNQTSNHIFSTESKNAWTTQDQLIYRYQDLYFKSYLGNYYSGHLLDSNHDGIVDTPYDLPGEEPDDPVPIASTQNNYIFQSIPMVSFGKANQIISESAGSVSISISLNQLSGIDIEIPFQVSGSALNEDYTLLAGSMIISSGTYYTTLTIQIIDDLLYENDETIIITLPQTTNAIPWLITTHTIRIIDNDAPPDEGLIAYLPFSNHVLDETGHHLDGTLVNAIFTEDRSSKPDMAIYFDGQDDYIELANSSDKHFIENDFSLTAWVQLTDTNPLYHMIIGKHVCGYENGYFLGVMENRFVMSVSTYQWSSSKDTYNDNAWHFVAGVYDDGYQLIYVDGELKQSLKTKNPLIKNDVSITIGGTLPICAEYGDFIGKIDEVRIYDRALSESEILVLSNSNAIINRPPNPPGSPYPSDNSSYVTIPTHLSWTGGDPNQNDLVRYDIYFGVENPPPLVVIDSLTIGYTPQTLSYDTMYYWRIIAKDKQNAQSQSRLWRFTTMKQPVPPIEMETFETFGANTIKSFTIDDRYFLAVLNTSETSMIYEYKDDSYTPFQSLPGNDLTDIAFFMIDSILYFITTDYNHGAVIYQWQALDQAFSQFQTIRGNGSNGCEYFQVNEKHYLAIANDLEDSRIYIWQNNRFEQIQSIPTQSAQDWEFFEINHIAYLAVANYRNNDTRNIHSMIYKMNNDTFEPFQSIPTHGARDCEYMMINGDAYLAIANYNDDISHHIMSDIYIWQNNQFEHFQSIPTIGAYNWHHFMMDPLSNSQQNSIIQATHTSMLQTDSMTHIHVNMDYIEGITAIGMTVWLPKNGQLSSTGGINPPQIQKNNQDMHLAEFGWFMIPEKSIQFDYTITGMSESDQLSAVVFYRFQDNPEQQTIVRENPLFMKQNPVIAKQSYLGWDDTQSISIGNIIASIDSVSELTMTVQLSESWEFEKISGSQPTSISITHSNMQQIIFYWNQNDLELNLTFDYTLKATDLITAPESLESHITYGLQSRQIGHTDLLPKTISIGHKQYIYDTDHYLIIANAGDNTQHDVQSMIYKFSSSGFEPIQPIDTNGAHQWDSFFMDQTQWLAVANFQTNSSYAAQSQLFTWEGMAEKNHAPFAPDSPEPANGLNDVLSNTSLYWNCMDSDINDSLTYDIYLGTESPPPLVAKNYTRPFYQPSPFSSNTTYYWRIITTDSKGVSVEGPLWHFISQFIPNRAPQVMNSYFEVNMNEERESMMKAIDPDNDPLTFIIVTQPAKGMVRFIDHLTGLFIFTPYVDVTGTDSFIFKADDGNIQSEPATMTFYIIPPDQTPPVITLQGDNPIIMVIGQKYEEPGWNAQDNRDGEMTVSNDMIIGHVNTEIAGTYFLTYTVQDSWGNSASVTRTVLVYKKPQQIVQGHIMDIHFVPLSGVTISVFSESYTTQTNDQGEFILPPTTLDQSFYITCALPGFITKTVSGHDISNDAQITLIEDTNYDIIHGQCVSITGNKISDYPLLIQAQCDAYSGLSLASPEDGYFSIPIPSGDISCQLTATSFGYAPKQFIPSESSHIQLIPRTKLIISPPSYIHDATNPSIELSVTADPPFMGDPSEIGLINAIDSILLPFNQESLSYTIQHTCIEDFYLTIVADTTEDYDVLVSYAETKVLSIEKIAVTSQNKISQTSQSVIPGIPIVVKSKINDSRVHIQFQEDGFVYQTCPQQIIARITEYPDLSEYNESLISKVVNIEVFNDFYEPMRDKQDALKKVCITLDYSLRISRNQLLNQSVQLFSAQSFNDLINQNYQLYPFQEPDMQLDAINKTLTFCTDHLSIFGFYEMPVTPSMPIANKPEDESKGACFIETIGVF